MDGWTVGREEVSCGLLSLSILATRLLLEKPGKLGLCVLSHAGVYKSACMWCQIGGHGFAPRILLLGTAHGSVFCVRPPAACKSSIHWDHHGTWNCSFSSVHVVKYVLIKLHSVNGVVYRAKQCFTRPYTRSAGHNLTHSPSLTWLMQVHTDKSSQSFGIHKKKDCQTALWKDWGHYILLASTKKQSNPPRI